MSFQRLLKSVNNSLHFWSLSSGKRASMLMVSSVIPTNCSAVTGPLVFSCAIGTPKQSQRLNNLLKSNLHLDSDSAINKKSCNMCKTPDVPRKCLASHFKSSARGRTTHRQAVVKEIGIISFHTQQMVIVRMSRDNVES